MQNAGTTGFADHQSLKMESFTQQNQGRTVCDSTSRILIPASRRNLRRFAPRDGVGDGEWAPESSPNSSFCGSGPTRSRDVVRPDLEEAFQTRAESEAFRNEVLSHFDGMYKLFDQLESEYQALATAVDRL